ncbi:hypothetical protein V6N13_123876 [Hibiscus sabdariffa]|uniref:Uncharacterized protein n=1 Tax=Hibiscus sabdariffa TaxID=183260 RepID=A0ABR2QUN2_9ROSI
MLWLMVEQQPRHWAAVDGGGEKLGVDPNGVSGILSLLCSARAAGVVAGLLVVVWLETGMTGGDGGGVHCCSARAEGPASFVGTAAAGVWLAGGVGIATLIGMTSARSILRI